MLRARNACMLSCLLSMIAIGGPKLSSGQTPSAKDNGETTREKHVRKAVRHLELAGLNEDARRLAKDHLAPGIATAVDVSFRLVEFRTTEMRELGIDWQLTDTRDVNGSNFETVLSALRRQNLVKILASPTLRTVPGRASHLKVGGENANSQMQLKVFSEVLQNGVISLDICLNLGNTVDIEATVQGKEQETQIAATSKTTDGSTLYLLVTTSLSDWLGH